MTSYKGRRDIARFFSPLAQNRLLCLLYLLLFPLLTLLDTVVQIQFERQMVCRGAWRINFAVSPLIPSSVC